MSGAPITLVVNGLQTLFTPWPSGKKSGILLALWVGVLNIQDRTLVAAICVNIFLSLVTISGSAFAKEAANDNGREDIDPSYAQPCSEVILGENVHALENSSFVPMPSTDSWVDDRYRDAPDWYRDFDLSIFSILSSIRFSTPAAEAAEMQRAIEAFWTNPTSLDAVRARQACNAMALLEFAQVGPSADLRVEQLFSLWQAANLKRSIKYQSAPRSVGQILAQYYQTLLDIRALDRDLSRIIEEFGVALNYRIGFEVDPRFGEGIYFGFRPSKDQVKLEAELEKWKAFYQTYSSTMQKKLSGLRDLCVILQRATFVNSNLCPSLDIHNLESEHYQLSLKEALELVPFSLRQRLGLHHLPWFH